ncbi:MAG TPA: hypothetical protein VKB54_00350 [Solirubrobacteraceae bacterium]|nr:hypothetical protein [Solirubrobacteraceae bacterium]
MTAPLLRRAVLGGVAAALVAAGTAGAVIGLPADGSQVNNDPGAGIDPNQNAGVSDIVGGSLAAGGPRVPWATFEQQAGGAQRIFVRAFKNGQWVTQGPSLNIDQNVEAEAPSIDFAGAGRTVPWDAWYEPNAALGGQKQIFASRFVAAANTWQPEGQDRGSGVPSLNIHTDKEAENPSVAGGAAVAGADPVPWVAWEEQDGNVNGSGNHDQIFVSKGVKQAAPNQACTGFKPSDAASVSNFCWQQVGLDRLAKDGGSSATGDPTLNVDPSRNGVEPDIAFTGPSDTVAWTVWYEKDNSNIGLRNNEQVFAAKIVKAQNADGGFQWQAVGNGTTGQNNVLDTTGANGFGACAVSTAAEDACSLNKLADHDAEDPRVATGTDTPGGTTVPWVTWSEDVGGHHAIFVSRLVTGDHFVVANAGNPVSAPDEDAGTPDITFFGNTPYVSWVSTHGADKRGFVGHFDSTGRFVTDTPGGIRLQHGGPLSLIDARVALSSNCTADPFTADGSNCPTAAVNAPFDTFTTAGSPQRLFSQALTGGPNCVLFANCKLEVVIHHRLAQLIFKLRQGHRIGIIVDRVDKHGDLKRVGRVPLGSHPRSTLHLRWNLKVNGHRLRPGRYRVTLRALDKKGNVLGLSRPAPLHIG